MIEQPIQRRAGTSSDIGVRLRVDRTRLGREVVDQALIGQEDARGSSQRVRGTLADQLYGQGAARRDWKALIVLGLPGAGKSTIA